MTSPGPGAEVGIIWLPLYENGGPRLPGPVCIDEGESVRLLGVCCSGEVYAGPPGCMEAELADEYGAELCPVGECTLARWVCSIDPIVGISRP